MLLRMHDGILYGPVNSRRLGKSLGINLSPHTNKLCSFNCIYCHYGWTKRQTLDNKPFRDELPPADKVIAAVEEAMSSDLEFAYITFSGNGEPTLHPDFPYLVDEVIRLRDKYRPEVKVALLTNSTGLVFDSIRKAVSRIERPFCKLDAGTETVFREINRPPDTIRFQDIVESLVGMKNIYTQTVLVDGNPSNITEEELDAWFSHIGRIMPVEAHIYSIDRPVPDKDIRLVSPERLQEIAEEGTRLTGVPIRAFFARG